MSQSYDKFGRPSNLESPEDLVYPYRIDSSFINDKKRLTSDRAATLEDIMLMVSILLHKYETTYKNHLRDNSLIWMPYLFQRPSAGTEIKNITTGEIYTIKEVIINPDTKIWEGLIRLNYTAYPQERLAQRLQFIDKDKLVRFQEDPADKVGNENQTQQGIIIDKGPMRATITYSLVRKEPGSIDRTPFGPRKDYRKRVREYIKDPNDSNHTIEIRAQTFDNLVQFDCCTIDNASANRLARWLEKFFDLYEWVLKKNGAQQILYLSQTREADSQKLRQDLVVRNLQYFFRTEEIEAISRRDLSSINYTINLGDHIEDTQIRHIAGQEVSGQISVQEYRDLFRDSDGNYLFGNVYLNDGNL